jgi:hypothetical protein
MIILLTVLMAFIGLVLFYRGFVLSLRELRAKNNIQMIKDVRKYDEFMINCVKEIIDN